MVRCTQFINIIERDNITDLVNKVSDQVITGLRQISQSAGLISSVRGKGSLIAFTLPSPEHRAAMLGAFMDAGVIALPCGKRSVRFRLPLVMTVEDADSLLNRTNDAVQALAMAV
jgi:L-lysine 6-transaminase